MARKCWLLLWTTLITGIVIPLFALSLVGSVTTVSTIGGGGGVGELGGGRGRGREVITISLSSESYLYLYSSITDSTEDDKPRGIKPPQMLRNCMHPTSS